MDHENGSVGGINASTGSVQSAGYSYVIPPGIDNYWPNSTHADSNYQRVLRLYEFLNQTAKSGEIKPRPVLREIAKLLGLDPNEVVYSG